jgi:membrane protease YdiL (CAAX protease family)
MTKIKLTEIIKNNRLFSVFLVLAVFYLLNYHAIDLVRLFFPDIIGYPRWGARMIVETVGCIIAVMALYNIWLTGALKEMAMIKPVHTAFLLAFVATLPMSLTFGISSSFVPDADAMRVLFFTILSPVTEEILFRGFAFWMLYRYARLGFWTAALLPAAIFGLMHMAQSQELFERIGIIAITGVGGIWFSWLLMRWENLWVPISFHVLMNFWWMIFDAGATALGDVFANIARAATVLLSILFTIWKDKLPDLLRADGN